MKKTVSLFSLLITTLALQAQMTVTTYGALETEILDGDIISVGSLAPQAATVYFYIHNNFDEDIDVRVKVEQITNTDGDEFQFCFATLCIFSIEEGAVYPEQGGPVTIPAGGTNVEFDKFQNENAGDGENYPLDYVFKFFQVDENDEEIGESITFTYRFDPNLSTIDHSLNAMGVTLKNTIGNNSIWFDSTASVNYQMFDLNGRSIQSQFFAEGSHQVGISQLKAGLYLLKFTDNQGRTATAKFVKK